MKLTTSRHTVLARLSDRDWRLGHDLGAPAVLASLQLADYIRCGIDGDALQDRLWCLTPDGEAALRGAGE
jgi:hypothetical protein